jgi:putative flavoprotein involved in K+ transport
MKKHYTVIIVGGGQSGLSASYYLKERNIDHLVLERHRIGHAWENQRWDSFCLVTPNWQCRLPGFSYSGEDPYGFMQKDLIVKYIKDYAAAFAPPLIEGVEVLRLRRIRDGEGFELETSVGQFTADNVVIAVGGYHVPSVPRMAERLASGIAQVHSAQYKNPRSIPEGEILVVGTGQSGCQIAEDLHIAGRKVHLCVGGTPRVARRYRGKDVVEWLEKMRYYELPVHEHPLKEGVRGRTNHYVTGRDGGRDIDLRKLAKEGMKLYGRLTNVDGATLTFSDDLKQNLDKADEVSESIKTSIDKYIDKERLTAPTEPRYVPIWEPREKTPQIDLHQLGIRTIIWSIGYKSDFRWIEVPVFDGKGYPGHHRGITDVDGLYFLGLPWLYTWGSGRFSGIGRDAQHVVDHVEARCKEADLSLGGEAAVLDEVALGS